MTDYTSCDKHEMFRASCDDCVAITKGDGLPLPPFGVHRLAEAPAPGTTTGRTFAQGCGTAAELFAKVLDADHEGSTHRPLSAEMRNALAESHNYLRQMATIPDLRAGPTGLDGFIDEVGLPPPHERDKLIERHLAERHLAEAAEAAAPGTKPIDMTYAQMCGYAAEVIEALQRDADSASHHPGYSDPFDIDAAAHTMRMLSRCHLVGGGGRAARANSLPVYFLTAYEWEGVVTGGVPRTEGTLVLPRITHWTRVPDSNPTETSIIAWKVHLDDGGAVLIDDESMRLLKAEMR